MRAILDSERMRSDRGNAGFALLVWTLPSTVEPRDLGVVGKVVRERIRVTDDAGFLDPRQVGVLLPATPAAGAWKLADDLCQLLPEQFERSDCEVFVYPPDRKQQDFEAIEVAQRPELPVTSPMEVLFVQALPAWKRAIDVVCGSIALVLAAPLMLVVALAIKATSRGSVLYAQQREGLGGRRFSIYKFRTMGVNAESLKTSLRWQSEQDGPAFKLKNDPRVTPVGRWLRRTCIDELPQLFNVLRGDMSLVGPRPLPVSESAQCRLWQRRRLDVTPGLTCTWQVHGGTKVPFTEWMRMDLRYACSRSLRNDLRLMVMTVPAVIRRDGVY